MDPTLEASFKSFSEKITEGGKNKTIKMTDDEALQLYKYYKQATVGDNNTAKPGMFAMKDKAKWTAWDSVKGTDKKTAMEKYIDLAKKWVK